MYTHGGRKAASAFVRTWTWLITTSCLVAAHHNLPTHSTVPCIIPTQQPLSAHPLSHLGRRSRRHLHSIHIIYSILYIVWTFGALRFFILIFFLGQHIAVFFPRAIANSAADLSPYILSFPLHDTTLDTPSTRVPRRFVATIWPRRVFFSICSRSFAFELGCSSGL
ncbi:hypothetical protein F4819DRAFT_156527 [Hypoxylon fuscum]|nr:hypothetical protein F4819DRAFT_156527 [Hypoxylon fuscum]